MRNNGQSMQCMKIAVVVGLMLGIASQTAAKPLTSFQKPQEGTTPRVPERDHYFWIGPGRFDKKGGATQALKIDKLELIRLD